MLVRAKLPKPRPVNTRLAANRNMNGVTRCSKGTGKNGCKACPLLTKHPREIIKEIKVNSSGETIKVEGKINCKTKNILYILQSQKNPKQYGGQTGKEAGQRALGHGRDIENQKEDKAVAKHFKDTKSTRNDLIFTPVKKLKSDNPWVRLHFEREMLNRHNLIDEGININL